MNTTRYLTASNGIAIGCARHWEGTIYATGGRKRVMMMITIRFYFPPQISAIENARKRLWGFIFASMIIMRPSFWLLSHQNVYIKPLSTT